MEDDEIIDHPTFHRTFKYQICGCATKCR